MSGGRRHGLVVLDKDPLEDIRKTHSIRYVMKNGEILEGDAPDEVWSRLLV